MVHGNASQQEAKTCIVCGEQCKDGLMIWKEFVCRSCENEMVNTDVKDEKYPFFIKQMRQIWLKKDA